MLLGLVGMGCLCLWVALDALPRLCVYQHAGHVSSSELDNCFHCSAVSILCWCTSMSGKSAGGVEWVRAIRAPTCGSWLSVCLVRSISVGLVLVGVILLEFSLGGGLVARGVSIWVLCYCPRDLSVVPVVFVCAAHVRRAERRLGSSAAEYVGGAGIV